MVEQGTHKPLDVGSNPTLATVVHVGVIPLFTRRCGGSISFL